MKTKIIVILSIIFALSSCKKENESTNSSGTGSSSTTTCTYVNNTYEPVNISLNGQSQVINPGANVAIKGTAGTVLSGTAYTSGLTSSGAQVGLKISWTINDKFPSTGNFTNNLNIGSNIFFLKLVNSASYQITAVYVNYGLQAQTLDNITIPNDGKIYNIGYYNAYGNSNVRAENGNTYWYWSTLNIPGAQNQSVTVTAN